VCSYLCEVNMYAVIKTGGKQYKVVIGEKLKIEQIPSTVGQEITFSEVLAVGQGDDLKIGSPFLSGASVTATVIAEGRHDKVRRRKHYQKRQGHRQNYIQVQIQAINV
jgi:large subunit ribosomal protein L21